MSKEFMTIKIFNEDGLVLEKVIEYCLKCPFLDYGDGYYPECNLDRDDCDRLPKGNVDATDYFKIPINCPLRKKEGVK